ncbi:MAG: S-layer homology domain-containing protein [Clostridiales bacterium]|jgi:hypothetical protein|nr:S-layer homology domain-containing protein [Clostridiales bacterium]
MGFHRQLLGFLGVFVLMSIFASVVYGGVKYKDVPETYWAFSEISEISDKGLIVGDASGNFKPEAPMDKFETTRILAKSMGYKYTNVTSEDRAYYKQAYDKNKSIISQYAKPYIKWKSAHDYEIAFLLEKEIYTVEDLSGFIEKDENGVQQYRALSRQEAAVYLVKLMGLKTEALTAKYNLTPPADDSDIKKSYKPYVYCLIEKQIEGVDDEGKFNPNNWVTRAEMAVMLQKSLDYNASADSADQDLSDAGADEEFTEATQIVSLTGSITKFYPEFDSVQISSGSAMNIYKLATDANIYVDSFLKTRANLKTGMSVKAVLANGKLVDLQAFSLSIDSSIVPVSNRQVSTVRGVLSEIRHEDSGIAIDLSLIDQDGKPGESKTFVLDKNCKITRDGAETGADTLAAGDVVTADISGGICLGLILEKRDREIKSGTLLEKKVSDKGNILTIKDQSGLMYDLIVDSGASILRQNVSADYADLRMGDMIDAYCAFDRLTSISAKGIKTELIGVLTELLISADSQSVVLKTGEEQGRRFYIISDKVDAYSLRVGAKMRVNLDSWEVEAVEIVN